MQKRESAHRSVSRLLAIIVIYKVNPIDSPTLQTLLSSAASICPEELDLKVVVWDNTPGGQRVNRLPGELLYHSAPNNPGLAVAYNQMLTVAEAEGYDWLLTLDQDTVLPATFLKRMSDLTQELSPVKTISAIVPLVVSDNRMISPFTFRFGAVPKWFSPGFIGVTKRAVYPINSGAVLRVSALREVNGYDLLFPLDVSDINLFHHLQAFGNRVFVAGDLLLRHDLALLKKETRMSPDRYHACLLDGCAFWDMHMGSAARFERLARLVGRTLRDSVRSGRTNYRRLTLLEIKRRIFKPKSARIAEWKAWATQRLTTAQADQIEPPPAAIE